MHNNNNVRETSQATLTSVSRSRIDLNDDVGNETFPTDLDFDLIGFGQGWNDWRQVNINGLELQHPDDQSTAPVTQDSISLLPTDSWDPPLKQQFQIGQMSSLIPSSVPMMPTYTLRSFFQLPATKGRAQTTTTLMLHILTSFSYMMQSHDSLPPFIHPYSLSVTHAHKNNSVEALTTCISLIQMLHSNVSGSRKLLWKNVRFECERMSEEVRPLPSTYQGVAKLTAGFQAIGFDRWGLLHSMQALIIYMILRLQEGETSHNNIDVLLLSTVYVLCSPLSPFPV
jgi:hypothetical protein